MLTRLSCVAVIAMAAVPPVSEEDEPGMDEARWNLSLVKDHWPMHDMSRPLPPRVEPAAHTPGMAAGAPADAIVLLDGTSTKAWQDGEGSAIRWRLLDDRSLEIAGGTGDIQSRETFGDCQVHIEWMCPAAGVDRSGQSLGNSGVFLMGLYEVQVLDTRENRTYADGMAGAIYGQNPPLVNPARPAGEWQSYDIIFRRPRFNEDGALMEPAVMTVFFNGVLVQDHFRMVGPTSHQVQNGYTAHADALPLRLQDHGDPVRFRNVWVRRL